MNGSNTRRVTLLNNPYTNPANGLPWTVGQDVRGFQYQIALDALPPGITLDMIEQSQDWFVDNDTTCYRLKLYAGASGDPITISGNTGIVVSGTTTVSGETGYYISVYDTTTQTVANATTAYPITINTFAEGNGITLGASGQFYVENTAVYNLQFSVQLAHTGANVEDANIWLRMAPSGTVLSGTSTAYDVPFSAGQVGVPGKHSGTDGHTIAAWNYVMTISGGQYVQLWWQPEATDVSITTLPAGTTPTTPITPSVIVTMQQVTSMISGGTTISGVAAGGDLTGYYPDPSLVSITTGGYYGSSTEVPVIGVDAKGRVFSATTATLPTVVNQNKIQKITVAGHSYTDQTSGYNETMPWGTQYNTTQSFVNRLMAIMGVTGPEAVYLGRAGAVLQWDETTSVSGIINSAGGGWARVLQKVTNYNVRAPYTSNNGVCIAAWGINDVNTIPSGIVGYNAFSSALRTVVSRFRASSVYEIYSNGATDSSIVRSGGTLVTSNTQNSGDGYYNFTTVGSGVTITVPSSFEGGTIALGFVGVSGNNGGTATVTVDSVVNGTINTSNISINSSKTGMVYRCQNLVSGTHTIAATVSSLDSVGAGVAFNYWQIETPYPNPVIVANTAKLNYYAAGYNGSNAEVETYNSAVTSVVSEFENPIAIADWQELLVGGNNRIASDLIHPSELGAMYLATEVWQQYLNCGGPTYTFSGPTNFNARMGLPVLPLAPLSQANSTIPVRIGQTGIQRVGTWSSSGGVPTFTPLTATRLVTDTMYLVPIKIAQPCTLGSIVLERQTSGGGGGMQWRMGLYNDYLGWPTNLLATGPLVANSTTSQSRVSTFSTPVKIVDPGVYWLAIAPQGGVGTQAVWIVAGNDPLVESLYFPAFSIPLQTTCYTVSNVTGALPSILTPDGLYGTTIIDGTSDFAPEISVTVISQP